MPFDREKEERDNNIIFGRNPVLELLKTDDPVDKILLIKSENKVGILEKIKAIAKEKNIPVKETTREKLNSICQDQNHQGVIAYTAAFKYSELEDIENKAKEKNEELFVIICDEIEDPHNLGAIIRTAEAVGAHGIIIPKRRAVGLTSIAVKSSAGAINYMPVVRVSNLVSTIQELKKKNVWVYAADMDGKNWKEVNYSGKVALIIGSEGNGVSRLVKENSDVIVSLPMYGEINSLNASVAGALVMYEIASQRHGK